MSTNTASDTTSDHMLLVFTKKFIQIRQLLKMILVLMLVFFHLLTQ